MALNLAPVQVYGETEFWFASLKVLLIIGLLILAFILFWGGGPDHQRLGFHYWKDHGARNHTWYLEIQAGFVPISMSYVILSFLSTLHRNLS